VTSKANSNSNKIIFFSCRPFCGCPCRYVIKLSSSISARGSSGRYSPSPPPISSRFWFPK
jgi:hypothetical protein